jgi:Zn-dependent protease
MNDPNQARPAAPPTNRGVSFVFVVLLLVFAGAVVEVGLGRGGGIGVFVVVFVGWIVSLCLHEWGHAATAWAGGDKSVEEMGYLSLNPIRYANPLLSIALPLAFLAMGGIGFPGGAVYVRTDRLRGPGWRAAVSAAGPAMNLLCLVAIGAAIRFIGMGEALTAAFSLLAFLQATAFVLNLLPIPGLDGFGIIESLFPEHERAAMARIGSWVSLLFLVVIVSAPQLLQPVWQAAASLCNFVGISSYAIGSGLDLFRFWAASPN